jgi:Cu+-exporting ATPase
MRFLAKSFFLTTAVCAAWLVALGGAPPAGGPGAAKPQAQAQAQAVDPICGMTVDPAKAAGKSRYKGVTYYFCSDYCKRKFDAGPEEALKKAPPKK